MDPELRPDGLRRGLQRRKVTGALALSESGRGDVRWVVAAGLGMLRWFGLDSLVWIVWMLVRGHSSLHLALKFQSEEGVASAWSRTEMDDKTSLFPRGCSHSACPVMHGT